MQAPGAFVIPHCSRTYPSDPTRDHKQLSLHPLVNAANRCLLCVLTLQFKDGGVSLNEIAVLQPAATASHPYLSAQHHPELLLEAVGSFESAAVTLKTTHVDNKAVISCNAHCM